MKRYKIAIIGYGSIAKRHASNLKKYFNYKDLLIVSSQKINKFSSTRKISFLIEKKITHIIVANETYKHIKVVKFIEENFENVNVLIEKPIFEKNYNLKRLKNFYYIGYNLRFHPIIKYLKKNISNKKVLSTNILCKSYLPTWRNREFNKTYSGKKEFGGGVLLELSHELDYIQYLFGNFKILFKNLKKTINKKLNFKDSALIIGKTRDNNIILIDLDLFSYKNIRKIEIRTKNIIYECDLNKNTIQKNYKNNKKIIIKNETNNYDINDTYVDEIKSFLTNKKLLPKFNDGINTLRLIDEIEK